MVSPRLDQYVGQFTNNPISIDPASPLRDFLTLHPGLRFLRLQWQDYSGLLRARLIVPQHLLALTATQKLVHIPPIAFHCIVDNNLLPDLDPTGNHFLVPDWTSLRFLPSSPHPTATVMCGVLAATPPRPLDLGLCPRRALTTIVRHAAQSFSLHFRVGFEVEFEVFRRETPLSTPPHSKSSLTPASTSLGRFAVDGLRADIYPIIEEAVHHLLDAGVGIQTMQTEGRRGQYELSLAPRAPLEAVDELVFVHDNLKQELARHGLIATMAPRPVASRRQATGQHTHISISRTEVASEFLAGILARLPGLCAVCMPFEVSYERVQPYLGGEVVAWGMEDRTVPVRGIEEGHWELRCVDATANMYLALASVLGAGLLGVENEETLRWADSTRERPRENGVAGRQLNGIPEKSNGYHVDLLEKEVVQLGQLMDSSALEHFLRVKRFERDSLDRKDPEDVRTMLSELF
ncbi:unnamed protein product [Penicillium pancosmium]